MPFLNKRLQIPFSHFQGLNTNAPIRLRQTHPLPTQAAPSHSAQPTLQKQSTISYSTSFHPGLLQKQTEPSPDSTTFLSFWELIVLEQVITPLGYRSCKGSSWKHHSQLLHRTKFGTSVLEIRYLSPEVDVYDSMTH